MIEKPKKERRFLKALGRVGEILIQEVLIKIGSNLIKKIGGKKTLPSILFLLASLSLFAQFPNTGNKQRLGFQTTGDGLVYRGRAADTVSIKSSGLNNAYFILDTLNNIVYNYIKTKGGWQFSNGDTIIINNNFTQPVDSLFFKTSVATNNVDTAKMRWDSDLGTVVLGMYDKVPNELGFKNFWLVKNQTGSTISKNSIVYANGTVGASGRITVAKFIANGTIDAKYLLGITAHDLSNGEDGYVILFGKIRQVNTDTFAAGSILYPSPTVAGVWTDVEPVAPNIDMPIGFCINSHANNGTIGIKVASGYALHELHDVAITSPVDRASLYYKSGIWRDTTAALLTSDTASMLAPYFKDADTTSLNLTSRFAAKLNLSDTASMLTNYLRTGTAASTYLPLTGGTLTGALNGTTGTFNTRLGVGSFAGSPLLFASGTGNQEVHFAHSQNIAGATVTLRLTNTNAGFFDQGAYFQGIVNRGINEMSGALGTNGLEYIRLRGVDDAGVVGVGIFNTNPSFNLDVSGTFRATGASLIGGTLGVTGATTLSAPLTVNSSAVFNEGSTDSDFRVESDGNANMVFVDASTNRVGIGTNAPTKTLDVNGELRIATVTATPTALLGKDGSNVVGELGLGSGMSVGSGILSVQAAGASATGLVTSFGSQIFGGNKTFNGTVTFQDNGFFKKNIELPIVKINNADYTATTSNHTIIYTILTADKTLTIPNASDAIGMKYIISIFDIPEGNEALTLITPSLNLFVRTDGESSNVDIVGGYCTTIQSDGTKWYILSYAPMY